jgi:hypothetical protein
MGYIVKLRFGSYSLNYKGSYINFKVGEWVELEEDVALRLKGVQAGVEDKLYPYFDVQEFADKEVDHTSTKQDPSELEADGKNAESSKTEANAKEDESALAKKRKNAKKK